MLLSRGRGSAHETAGIQTLSLRMDANEYAQRLNEVGTREARATSPQPICLQNQSPLFTKSLLGDWS